MIINPVLDLLLSLADGASQPASLLAQWLQQPVSIHHDLAVWLSFDAQLRPGAMRSRPSFTKPIIMTIIVHHDHHENLLPSLPASAQKPQASPARSKHTGNALNGRDTRQRQRHVSFEQVCQPDFSTSSTKVIWTRHCRPSVLQSSPVQTRPAGPRQSVPRYVSALGLGKSFHAAAWDASLPGSSYPGRTTESELVPKSVWQFNLGILIFNNTSLHAHVLLVPCPGFVLPAISPSPVPLPSAAAPLAAPVRGVSNMSVPHAEL